MQAASDSDALCAGGPPDMSSSVIDITTMGSGSNNHEDGEKVTAEQPQKSPRDWPATRLRPFATLQRAPLSVRSRGVAVSPVSGSGDAQPIAAIKLPQPATDGKRTTETTGSTSSDAKDACVSGSGKRVSLLLGNSESAIATPEQQHHISPVQDAAVAGGAQPAVSKEYLVELYRQLDGKYIRDNFSVKIILE